MHLPNPKTIQEAQRQIRTLERAQAILDAGYQFTEQDGTIIVTKPERLAACYFIGLFHEGCDCPDFARHQNYCKHTVAWELLQERAAMEAQCAAYEEEYANDEGAFSTNGGGVLW